MMALGLHISLRMESIAYETLDDVTGAAGNWTTKVDNAVSAV